ncbi:MAG: hypothetical protein CL666_03800 [Balneola sp.]|nr:hypothetical protein [Balneola sp.]|tara:strand:- start:86015 stop:86209 length:195 start_codon:yes stop_codon:yes gene_type:complete
MKNKEYIKTLIISVTLLLISLGYFASNRYEIIGINSDNGAAYKLDNWTGDVKYYNGMYEYEMEK